MIDLAIPAVSGILGTILGAVLVWYSGRHQRQLQNTLELHREFNSKSLLIARAKTEKFLASLGPEVTLKDLYDDKQCLQQFLDAWEVVAFYQRFWLALANRQLSKSVAIQMFGETFIWWYVLYFDRHLSPVTDWSVSRDIQALWNYFESKRASISDYEFWNEIAHKNREALDNSTNDQGSV